MSETELSLTAEEQTWLTAYRKALNTHFPGLIDELIIFGSKARGRATEDSDLDMIVLIREGDWKTKKAVARPGYLLAIDTSAVPSLMVFTREEWERHRQLEAPFWQTVSRDGVAVE